MSRQRGGPGRLFRSGPGPLAQNDGKIGSAHALALGRRWLAGSLGRGGGNKEERHWLGEGCRWSRWGGR